MHTNFPQTGGNYDATAPGASENGRFVPKEPDGGAADASGMAEPTANNRTPLPSSRSDVNSSIAGRRLVARRACLSCREKKIKCDGEALQQSSKDAVSECSNCKFLGIECVFVQSMRGGRRRKRVNPAMPGEGQSKQMKFKSRSMLSSSTRREQGMDSSNTRSESTQDPSVGSVPESVVPPSTYSHRSSFGDPLRMKLPSPTLSYASTPYLDNQSTASTPMSFGSDSDRPFYRGDRQHYDSEHGYSRRRRAKDFGPWGPFAPPFDRKYRHYGPHGPHGHFPPPPIHHHPGFYPPPLPPFPPYFSGLPPPPPPPLPPPPSSSMPSSSMYPFYPHPHSLGHYGHPPGPQGEQDSSESPPPQENHPHASLPHGPHPHGPPLHGLHPFGGPKPLRPLHHGKSDAHSTYGRPEDMRPRDYSASETTEKQSDARGLRDSASRDPYNQHPPSHGSWDRQSSRRPNEKGGASMARKSSISDTTMSSPSQRSRQPWPNSNPDSIRSERRDNVASRSTSQSPTRRFNDTKKGSTQTSPHDGPEKTTSLQFNSEDLRENELPAESVLQEVLDFYYKYLHTNHLFLPPKQYFLKWFPPSSESSIYHAIIAMVCGKNTLKLERSEEFWIRKMNKFWDNLNDFGMLLCYSILGQTYTVRNNLQLSMENNSKISDIISSNFYLEKLKTVTRSNARKMYEQEATLRMVWDLWLRFAVQRLRSGHPYSRSLWGIGSSNITDLSFSEISSKIPPPLSGDNFIKLDDSNRMTWDMFQQNELDDYSCVLKATKILCDVLDKISLGELTIETLVMDPPFEEFMERNSYHMESGVMLLNPYHLRANLTLRCAYIIQYLHFIKDVTLFEFLMNMSRGSGVTTFGLAQSFSGSNLMEIEQLSSHIAQMSEFQWKCLISVMENCKKLFGLMGLYLGVEPHDSTSTHPVYYDVDNVKERSWPPDHYSYTHCEETTLKTCYIFDYCATLLACVMPSMTVLRSFIKLNRMEHGVEIVRVKDSTRQMILTIDVPDDILEIFEQRWLSTHFEKAAVFLRFSLQNETGEGAKIDTFTNINKIGHYAEEIVQSLK